MAPIIVIKSTIPHGYKRRGMLVIQGETPYNTGVKITAITVPSIGSWGYSNCTTVASCH